jgi:DNA-binding GntR family transcriptional regulator
MFSTSLTLVPAARLADNRQMPRPKKSASRPRVSNLPEGPQLKKGTTLDRVYGELRRAILSLELEPGSNLDENDFVAALNVSRTPIREAFLRLANDGLVTISPNRGAYVSSIELSKAREFFEALEISQRVATRWAASRRMTEDLRIINRYRIAFEMAAKKSDIAAMIEANIRFHNAIAASCNNSYIQAEYRYLLTLGFRFSQMSLKLPGNAEGYHDGTNVAAIIDEHREMAICIKAGDAETADRLARDHVTLFRNRILSGLSRSGAAELKL